MSVIGYLETGLILRLCRLSRALCRLSPYSVLPANQGSCICEYLAACEMQFDALPFWSASVSVIISQSTNYFFKWCIHIILTILSISNFRRFILFIYIFFSQHFEKSHISVFCHDSFDFWKDTDLNMRGFGGWRFSALEIKILCPNLIY